jgi:hypothetical protein
MAHVAIGNRVDQVAAKSDQRWALVRQIQGDGCNLETAANFGLLDAADIVG